MKRISNRQVRDYYDALPAPQRIIATKVRKLLLETIPAAGEEFRNGVPWYGKFYIAGFTNSVNVGFAVTGLSHDEQKLFEGSGKYMRHVKIASVEEIDSARLEKLFRLVWRKARCEE